MDLVKGIIILLLVCFFGYYLVTFGMAVVFTLFALVVAFSPLWIPLLFVFGIFYLIVKK